MKRRHLNIKYPKFVLLILTFVIAYLMILGKDFSLFHNFLLSLEYFGTFLAGVFFTYGFTAAPAVALLLIFAGEQNILLAGFIGGFGAMVGDLIIFKFIRYSFSDEIKKLSIEKPVSYISNKIPGLLKRYLILALAGFIIASPLPDEIGISLLSVSKFVSTNLFSVFSYVLNTIGIFVILWIGSLI